MRTWFTTKGIVLFFCLFYLRASFASDLSYIIEIQTTTPLYEKPSVKSKSVANADEKMLLLFVEKSRRGLWIKVRDVDGFEAWVPTDKTDYPAIEQARTAYEGRQNAQPAVAQLKHGKNKKDNKEENEEHASLSNPTFRLAPLYKILSKEPPTSPRVGLRFDWLSGNVPERAGRRQAQTFWVAEANVPPTSTREFSAALRSAWRFPVFKFFHYGLDLGYSADYLKSSQLRNHLSTGLGGGILAGPFDVTLRGGYDFFSQSRASIEIQLGCLF